MLGGWAFPCPQARSGYIARPPVRTYGTPAQLLRRPFGRIALEKVVTIPNAKNHPKSATLTAKIGVCRL